METEQTGASTRTSLAWDSTRQPRKSILKRRTLRRTTTLRSALLLPQVNEDDEFGIGGGRGGGGSGHGAGVPTVVSLDEAMNRMSMDEHRLSPSSHNTVTVKASTLYGAKYDFLQPYQVSTAMTIRYGLSSQRIQRMRDHVALVSFVDIYDLPALIKEVINQYPDVNSQLNAMTADDHDLYGDIRAQTGGLHTRDVINDFYCNAYWAVKMADAIAELVFEKLSISLDTDITYKASYDSDSMVLSIPETTHNIKSQISLCDWMTSTIAPNYAQGYVPIQIGVKLLQELENLVKCLTCANYMWIDYAVRVLC